MKHSFHLQVTVSAFKYSQVYCRKTTLRLYICIAFTITFFNITFSTQCLFIIKTLGTLFKFITSLYTMFCNSVLAKKKSQTCVLKKKSVKHSDMITQVR